MKLSTRPFLILAVLAGSCAASPAKPASGPPASKPAPAVSAPVAKASPEPAPVPVSFEPKRKLEAGQCEDSFDCVDTVGFPPSGHRWACINGKCSRAKLPNLVPGDSSATAAASAPKDQAKAGTAKPSKQQN